MDSQTPFSSANFSPVRSSDFLEIVLGSGNDTIFTSTEHSERTVYRGGLGIDRINLVFTSEQLQTILDSGQLPALKTYLSDPTNRRLELVSLLNFAAEGFEIAALYIQDTSNPDLGDRLVPISTDALLNTDAVSIGRASSSFGSSPSVLPDDSPEVPGIHDSPNVEMPELDEWIPPVDEAMVSLDTFSIASSVESSDRAIAEMPTLVGTPGVNTLFIAMDSAYTIKANSGNDYIYAGSGDDLIYTSSFGSTDTNQVWAGAGNDTIVLSSGADTIYGEDGDDLFLFNVPGYADGSALDGDTIYGGAGSDTIRNDTPGADIFLWQINNFYQFPTSTWILGVEVFDGNGGTIIGRDTLTNYLDFSVFESVMNVPLIRLGETYDLVNASSFTTPVEIHGLAGNDILIGGAGDDTLVGGPGDDVLTGGPGRDTFHLNAPGQGIDQITDFTPSVDRLRIAASDFENFQSAGPLQANRFVIGVAAQTSLHRIIYNPLNGDLLYDANGSGDGVGAVQIAILPRNLSLSHSDILVM
ncbi:calcium-binding protein [Thermoleptolyngbya sp. C42_A2020_037]|uniref:calcium-binding protein n=1 Tax=Thermoleptolyngbya sp. C42_A2020_037 TaxID=2747799 RepID=UPI0019F13FCD|nr:calcium-binding protein [Thermoleptolyngbya sp. C42_A2020_037]MBF2083914.1 calcium-binding protein [Thermoleptolyngbya sp. C42_A2020_037]